MDILVLGRGLMGPTMAKDCCGDPEVTKVTGCDVDSKKLMKAKKYVESTKFDTAVVNVTDHDSLVEIMKGYDIVIHGTASKFSLNALRAAMEAQIDIVDLAGGGYPQDGVIYDGGRGSRDNSNAKMWSRPRADRHTLRPSHPHAGPCR